MKILAVLDYFLASHQGGGAVRALRNSVEFLGDEFQFYVLTSDRGQDTLSDQEDMRRGVWKRLRGANVLYLARPDRRILSIARLLRNLDYDVLYLNSFFSHLCVQVLLLYQAGLIRDTAAIIAPRGEFYPGALSIHSGRKRLYLWFIRRLGLTRNIIWQATSLAEKQLVVSLFGCTDRVKYLPDIWVAPAVKLPLAGSLSSNRQKPAKEPGSVRVIFLSRIARNKNLAMALTLLSQVSTGIVQFDIYGPTEDEQYWAECQQLSRGLPAHIAVNYRGPVDPDDVIEVFSRYHLFLFPTRGESFSFAILEALWAGCLVLTSDQTPWQNLAEKNAGWTLPLAEPERFVRVLETLVAMDDAQFEERSQAAQTLAQAIGSDRTVIEANRQLFRLAASTFRDRSQADHPGDSDPGRS